MHNQQVRWRGLRLFGGDFLFLAVGIALVYLYRFDRQASRVTFRLEAKLKQYGC